MTAETSARHPGGNEKKHRMATKVRIADDSSSAGEPIPAFTFQVTIGAHPLHLPG